MKLQYLGDALDHWKGSLFQRLCKEGLLKDLYVEPMITDNHKWKEELVSYARLLNIRVTDIIHSDKTFANNHNNQRMSYFQSIKHQKDLFVDPDIGIATGNKTIQHIAIPEINLLLNINNQHRVLIVYQHTRQGITMPKRIDEVMNALNTEIKDIFCTSYESSVVAMLFISKNKERIGDINRYFHNLLPPTIKNRSRLWGK